MWAVEHQIRKTLTFWTQYFVLFVPAPMWICVVFVHWEAYSRHELMAALFISRQYATADNSRLLSLTRRVYAGPRIVISPARATQNITAIYVKSIGTWNAVHIIINRIGGMVLSENVRLECSRSCVRAPIESIKDYNIVTCIRCVSAKSNQRL